MNEKSTENHRKIDKIVNFGLSMAQVEPKMAKLGNKMGLVEHFGGNLEQLGANLEPTWGEG